MNWPQLALGIVSGFVIGLCISWFVREFIRHRRTNR